MRNIYISILGQWLWANILYEGNNKLGQNWHNVCVGGKVPWIAAGVGWASVHDSTTWGSCILHTSPSCGVFPLQYVQQAANDIGEVALPLFVVVRTVGADVETEVLDKVVDCRYRTEGMNTDYLRTGEKWKCQLFSYNFLSVYSVPLGCRGIGGHLKVSNWPPWKCSTKQHPSFLAPLTYPNMPPAKCNNGIPTLWLHYSPPHSTDLINSLASRDTSFKISSRHAVRSSGSAINCL